MAGSERPAAGERVTVVWVQGSPDDPMPFIRHGWADKSKPELWEPEDRFGVRANSFVEKFFLVYADQEGWAWCRGWMDDESSAGLLAAWALHQAAG